VNGIDSLLWLEGMGYRFECEGNNVTFGVTCDIDNEELARRHLEIVKLHKGDGVTYLQRRADLHKTWEAAYDKWCQSHSISDARDVVNAAIEADLPYYDTTAAGTVNLGAEGWREWLQEQRRTSADEAMSDENKRVPAYEPEPLPWQS
jgi:hypothetical protein